MAAPDALSVTVSVDGRVEAVTFWILSLRLLQGPVIGCPADWTSSQVGDVLRGGDDMRISPPPFHSAK